MCCWMGSHFHDWIDYTGVAFSIELLEWGRKFSDFLAACVASVSVRFRRKKEKQGSKTVRKMAQVKERGGGGEERKGWGGKKGVSFLPLPLPPLSIFWFSFNFSGDQNRKSPSTVSFWSETKRKRLLRRLIIGVSTGIQNGKILG